MSQTSATPIAVHATWQAPARRSMPSWVYRLVVFWLPAVVFGYGFVMANHSDRHAANATGDKWVEVDLTARVSVSDTNRQLGFLSMGMLGALLLTRPANKPWPDRRLLTVTAALAGYVLLSALWGDPIELSLRRSMVPLLMLLGALGVARHWRPRDLCFFAVLVPLCYMVQGVAAELHFGTFLRGEEYRFSGMLHPNRQAVNCAALALGAICLYVSSQRRRWLWLLLAALGCTLLVLTRSRTGLIAMMLACGLLWYQSATRVQRIVAAWGLGTMLCLGVLVMVAANADISASAMSAAKLGRQQETGEVTSLTGRIPIWRELRYDIAERPLFGYGYGCFWTGPRVYYLSALLDWEFDHAHSIYLQTILNLGLIGLALGLAVVIMTMRRAAAAYHRSGDIGYGFALAWLGMALPHGLLDSVFVQTGFAMLLCLLCLGVVAFHSREVLGADA